ncbi:site-specific recombinase [Rhodocyclaceae bacterium SMB388]
MEAVLRKFGQPGEDEVQTWVALVDRLRPVRANDVELATEHLRVLKRLLRRREDLKEQLRDAVIRLFMQRKVVSLYVSSGLLPSSGFFSETSRRISGRLLPDVVDTHYMNGVIATVFHKVSDEVWVNAIPDEVWIDFINTLFDPTEAELDLRNRNEVPDPVEEIIEALRMLSYHVSSIGLDPELVRIDPTLEEHESPFLAQNAELVAYLANYKAWWADESAETEDEKHLAVMLDQCEDVVLRIRRRAAKIGTSLSLTFKLERLHQHLERISALLALLLQLRSERNINSIASHVTRLLKELIRAECRKNKLSDYWGKNVELLSLRMTESASKTGERYITSNRREYFGILRSAALGGAIIAFMATLKVVLERQGFAPMNAGLAFCLNYGLGFVLIHILGGTVATKQPAMTANAIAASIGEARGKHHDLHNLVELIARTVRSQLGAILGNVGIAIPMAVLIGLVIHAVTGSAFVAPDEAYKMLDDVHPLSGAIVFAAIAGVCLFLSGLIAGYYDNLSAYGRIPQRLLQLRWPRRVFGEARMQRVSAYVESNLGALAGNFFFGFLLGGVTALGVLFGLPLDIRHIAFSSAYVGHALIGLEFGLPLQLAALSLLGVLLIGITNLTVSFALTLSVAMRARRITFAQGQELIGLIFQRLLRAPRDFFLPPKRDPRPEEAAPEPANGAPQARRQR